MTDRPHHLIQAPLAFTGGAIRVGDLVDAIRENVRILIMNDARTFSDRPDLPALPGYGSVLPHHDFSNDHRALDRLASLETSIAEFEPRLTDVEATPDREITRGRGYRVRTIVVRGRVKGTGERVEFVFDTENI